MSSDGVAARFVGQSIARREDPRLLAGRGHYVDDASEAGLLHVAFLRSDLARALIRRIETEEALRLPGVVAVLTAGDLQDAGPSWTTSSGPTALAPPLLASGDVRFVGDPIAMVVASSRYIAEDGCELIEVDLEPLEPVVDMHSALQGTVRVHPHTDNNIAAAIPETEHLRVDSAFRDADLVVTRTFRLARCTNVPLEGRGLIASWDPYSRQMVIRSSTQSPHEMRAFAARVAQIPQPCVRVIMEDVGGGFGQKMYPTREEGAVIAAARRLGRSLKWVEDRRENLIAANQARHDEATISMALTSDGDILASKINLLSDVGAYPTGTPGSAASMASLCGNGPYRVPDFSLQATSVYTNTCGKGAYRGPWAIETIAREQMMDHVARQLGMDPLEIRRRNVLRKGDLPWTLASGVALDDVSAETVLELAAEQFDIAGYRAEQRRARTEGRYVGIGFSLCIEPSAVGRGFWGSEEAVVRIDPSGGVTIMMGTGSHGQGVETTIPQIVADKLGCRLTDVHFVQGDTAATPFGPGTGGSRSAVIAGGAAMEASSRLRSNVESLASHLLEAAPEDLEIADSYVSVRGTPTANLSFAEIARAAYIDTDRLPPDFELGLEEAARFKPAQPFTWSTACHVCSCEVDIGTGQVRLIKYHVVEDCGTMINPMIVEGQIVGGVAQGIGTALLEDMAYDDSGNPLATTFLDYLIPIAADVPDVTCAHLETPSANPGGFRGMGEGGAIASPAAVANSIADALWPLGVEPSSLPLGPSQILALLSTESP